MSATLLDRGLVPNSRHSVTELTGRKYFNPHSTHQAEGERHDLDQIAVLKEENSTQFAVKTCKALPSTVGPHEGYTEPYQALHQMVYTNPINACSRAGNIAIRVFAHLEGWQWPIFSKPCSILPQLSGLDRVASLYSAPQPYNEFIKRFILIQRSVGLRGC